MSPPESCSHFVPVFLARRRRAGYLRNRALLNRRPGLASFPAGRSVIHHVLPPFWLAQEQSYYRDGERPDQTTRCPVTDDGEEGKEQEEDPLDLHVYTRGSSYLESTAHKGSPFVIAICLSRA